MKNVLVVLAMLFVFSACNTKVKKENEALKASIDSLQMKNDSLLSLNKEKSLSIEDYQKALAEIDKNLAEITSNQSAVAELKAELSETNDADIAESINQRIEGIKSLMENSRAKIIGLDQNLRKLRQQSGTQSEEILALDKQLEQASENLIVKQTEMDELRSSLEAQLDDLGVKLENQKSVSEELRSNLNRAYYIVEDSKTLLEKNIVSKEGGFIGLGKVKVINANANNQLFTKIDKTNFTSIPLDVKKANVITTHPTGSYQLVEKDKKVTEFKILDPEAFWKDANYLVIEVTE